ncbi:MAG: hypothetical protein MUO24_07730, partial [Desulfobacterales bacterium]|nr:hypothetical protein [Desulfobacterales bacterium]
MFYMLKREPTLLRWQVDTLKEDTFIALDDRIKQAEATVANARAAISEANEVVTSLGQTSNSLNEMLKTADGLMARHDDSVDRKLSRPFDIREYTEAVKELAVTVGKINDMLKSSNELLGSSEWDRRIQQVSQSADERMKMAAEQSQRVVYNTFWRVYVAIGILFAMFILCIVAVFLVIRWLRFVTGNASDAGRKEMSK